MHGRDIHVLETNQNAVANEEDLRAQQGIENGIYSHCIKGYELHVSFAGYTQKTEQLTPKSWGSLKF